MLCSVRCGSRPRVRSRLVRGPPLAPPPCTHLVMHKASSSVSRYDSTLSSVCVTRGSWIVGLGKHSLACRLLSHTIMLHQAIVEMGRCHALRTTSDGLQACCNAAVHAAVVYYSCNRCCCMRQCCVCISAHAYECEFVIAMKPPLHGQLLDCSQYSS